MNGYLVAPPQPWAAGQLHQTAFVSLPAGCVSVRGTVTPTAAVRSDPRLACEVQLVFRGADDLQVRGSGCAIAARAEFAPDEPTPISGHEAGQPPGVLPATAGGFVFVVEESPGVQQGPYRHQVAVQFRLSLADVSTVDCGVTLEAFDLDENPLEIA